MANQTVYPFGTGGSLPSSIGIINDLKTGGADKALAAEQGKVLGDRTEDYIELNLADFGELPGTIDVTTWTATNKHSHIQIKVNPGETYTMKGNATNYSRYAFLTELATWSASGTPPFVSGHTTVYYVAIGGERTFTIPEGCSYLFVAMENKTSSPADYTPQGLKLRLEIQDIVSDGDDDIRGDIARRFGTWPALVDNNTAEVASNNTSRITIEKVNGEIVVTNISSGAASAGIALPNTLVPGKTYYLTIDYTAGFNQSDNWWFALANSSWSGTSGGILLYPGISNASSRLVFKHKDGDVYIRLASSSQNTGAKVVIHSFSITDEVTIANLANRVSNLEENAGESDMENLIRQAKYVANPDSSPAPTPALALLHFSDIHGDTIAAESIKKFATKYSSYIDDLVQTGDTVYYYWDSPGQGYEWYQQNGIPGALFVLGNHDGAANSNEHGWKEVSADWDFKGKEWDFDTYFADYITTRGVTPPTGYDDSTSPYYKACYWHKDYADAKVRVIGLDCMHFNDGVRYTSNDQETWLAARLQDTLTSGNSAYGFSVVFLCHYALDDFSGYNETWDDATHKFIYNLNETGGTVMDRATGQPTPFMYGSSYTAEAKFSMRNRVGTVGSPNYTKGNDNPIADVIHAWMNNGGKYVVWLSGHTHSEYFYYPAKYPDMLCLGLPQAGNTSGNNEADRSQDLFSHSCANLLVIDTQNSLLKIIRFGKTLNKYFYNQTKLCYNYSSKAVTNR